MTHVSYYQSSAVFKPDNTNYTDWAFRSFASLLTGFIYQKYHFRFPMMVIMLINCVLTAMNYN